MITVAGTPPQKRQKGGVSGTGNLLKEIIMKFSFVNSFNVRWNGSEEITTHRVVEMMSV